MLVFLAPRACRTAAETVIRDNAQKYIAAFNAGDADAAAALYTPDGGRTNVLGITLHGRGGIAQDLREMTAGPWGAKISITTLRIRFLAPLRRHRGGVLRVWRG